MQMQAAVYREPNAPLTIETVDIDQPVGREVLVRTVAAGRLSQRPAHRPRHHAPRRHNGGGDGAGPRVRRHRRGGRARSDLRAARRSRRRVPLGLLRRLRAVPLRPPQPLPGRPPEQARGRIAAAEPERQAGGAGVQHRRLRGAPAPARELARAHRPRHPARPRRAGGLRRADRRRRRAADGRHPGGPDRRGVRLRRRRPLRYPGRAHRRGAARSSPSTSSTRSWRWRSSSAPRTPSTPATRTQSPRSGGSRTAQASTTPSRPWATRR